MSGGWAAWALPAVWGMTGVTAYGVATRRYRRLRRRSWPARRTCAWMGGVLLLVVALSPPLERNAAEATGHMAQHLLLGMYAPLLLVLGYPLTLLVGTVDLRSRQQLVGVLRSRPVQVAGHPVTAAMLHIGGLTVLYLTPLYGLSLRVEPVHLAVHVHFLLAGSLFAWAVAGPDPVPHRPGMPVRIIVLVLAGAVHGFLAKLLYSRAGELPVGAGHTVAESRTAAQWMYYGGDLGQLLLAAVLFAGWYRMAGHRHRRSTYSGAPAGAARG